MGSRAEAADRLLPDGGQRNRRRADHRRPPGTRPGPSRGRTPPGPARRDGGTLSPGSCPAHGDCWEGLASGPAIAERWGTPPAELPDDHLAWPLEAEYLALGILSIVCVASPHRVIVGGGVMQRPQLLPLIRHRLRELLAGYLDHPLLGADIDDYLVTPALGDDAGVLGAIALAEARSR